MVRMFKFLFGSRASDQIVPPRGNSAWLTFLAAVAMAFVAVFALALALSVARVAERWALDFAQTATVRIVAPADEIDAQTEAALKALLTTPGIAAATILDDAAQAALLEPWLGKDLPIDILPLPKLIEVSVIGDGPDIDNLLLRLSAEAPGAIFDDHSTWREPLRKSARTLRVITLMSLLLVAMTTAIMVTLAANSSLAANTTIIQTLRLIGATDAYIARAFVRRITFRTLAGAIIGTIMAMSALYPYGAADGTADGGVTGLIMVTFVGWHWLMPVAVPVLAALTAYFAARFAAAHHLRRAA